MFITTIKLNSNNIFKKKIIIKIAYLNKIQFKLNIKTMINKSILF